MIERIKQILSESSGLAIITDYTHKLTDPEFAISVSRAEINIKNDDKITKKLDCTLRITGRDDGGIIGMSQILIKNAEVKTDRQIENIRGSSKVEHVSMGEGWIEVMTNFTYYTEEDHNKTIEKIKEIKWV